MNFKTTAIKVRTKIKGWWLTFLIYLGRNMGMITLQEHEAAINELKRRNVEISRLAARKDQEATNLRKALEELPFNFDKLLSHYNTSKMNALVYRMINNMRNNPERSEYLERWEKRCADARQSLQPDGEEDLSS